MYYTLLYITDNMYKYISDSANMFGFFYLEFFIIIINERFPFPRTKNKLQKVRGLINDSAPHY